MKKIQKLKLHQLSERELVKKDMDNLVGGRLHAPCRKTDACGCGCYYEVSNNDNGCANADSSISSGV